MIYYIDETDERNIVLKEILKNSGKHIENISKCKYDSPSIFIFSPAKKLNIEDIKHIPDNSIIFAGDIKDDIKKIIDDKNILHKNFMTDEIFAIKNAHLTSEGILALLITNTEKSIYDLNILFFGAGRITKTTAIIFSKLGINYKICNYHTKNYENAYVFSKYCYFSDEYKKDAKSFDVIINTIPYNHLSYEDTLLFKPNTLYIETASIDGVNRDNCGNLKFLSAPALPKKYSKISASEIMNEYIEKEI